MEDRRVMALQKHRGRADSSVWVGRRSALRHLVVVCLCMVPVVSSTRQEPEPENVHVFMWVIQGEVSVKWVCDCVHHVLAVLNRMSSVVVLPSPYVKGTNRLFIHWISIVSLSYENIVPKSFMFPVDCGPCWFMLTLQFTLRRVTLGSMLTIYHTLCWVTP